MIERFEIFSKQQLKILTWWTRPKLKQRYEGIIADGAIRSGKTVSMSLSFVRWAMTNFNNNNFGMCGKTIGSFRRNVLNELIFHLKRQGFDVVEHRIENFITISKGKIENHFYLFGGKDERSQDLIQGATLAGVFFDEVALMPESFVNQATGRCSVSGSKYWFNCNPEHSEHWFKKNWIDKRDDKNLLYLHFTLDDNPKMDPEIRARYENNYVGVFKRRYIYGEWCVAEGLVYSNYDVDRDPIDEIPERLNGKRYISVDYGTQNPCVFLMWEQGLSGTWYLTDEYYYSGRDEKVQKTDSEYLLDFIKFVNNKQIKAVVVDPSAASFIAELKKAGFKVKKAKNDVIDGIRFTASALQREGIKILRHCKMTLAEFSAYCWDEKKSEDTPIKVSDHAMDAMRYFAYTIIRIPRRPRARAV